MKGELKTIDGSEALIIPFLPYIFSFDLEIVATETSLVHFDNHVRYNKSMMMIIVLKMMVHAIINIINININT